MAVTIWKDAALVTQTTELGGVVAWVNPNEVTSPFNQIDTTANLTSGNPRSYTIKPYNFQFDVSFIPYGSTIDGIEVLIFRQKASGDFVIRDKELYLVLNENIIGSNKASATNWTTSFVDATYGGASDKWGTSLNGKDIRDFSFGIAFQAQRVSGSTGGNALVRAIRVRIHYTPPMSEVCLPMGEIAFSDINEIFARGSSTEISINQAEAGSYGTIDTGASPKPNGAVPNALSEWQGYCHPIPYTFVNCQVNADSDPVSLWDIEFSNGVDGSYFVRVNGGEFISFVYKAGSGTFNIRVIRVNGNSIGSGSITWKRNGSNQHVYSFFEDELIDEARNVSVSPEDDVVIDISEL